MQASNPWRNGKLVCVDIEMIHDVHWYQHWWYYLFKRSFRIHRKNLIMYIYITYIHCNTYIPRILKYLEWSWRMFYIIPNSKTWWPTSICKLKFRVCWLCKHGAWNSPALLWHGTRHIKVPWKRLQALTVRTPYVQSSKVDIEDQSL